MESNVFNNCCLKMTMDDLAYISFVPKSVTLMLGGKFAFQN